MQNFMKLDMKKILDLKKLWDLVSGALKPSSLGQFGPKAFVKTYHEL